MKKHLLVILSCFGISASVQSQITWSAGMNIAASSFGNMHPRMVIDANKNPVVIWGRMSDESVFIARWNGTAFTMPMKVNPTSLTIATASWMGPDIAAKGDTVYVVMKQTPEAADSCHIWIESSFDGGITFSAPVQVERIADSISRFPTVTTDGFGNPIVGFMKFNSSFLDSRWAVTRSNDFGSTFTTDVKASGWSGGVVCDCCPGAIVNDASNTLMLYRDNTNNIRDQWAGISTDGGNTFSFGMPIDQNNWMITSCPSSGPDGAIVGDSLYSVYASSASGMSLVYYSASSISAMQGSTGNPITGSFTNLSTQNYPRISTDGTAMALAWRQHVGGDQFALLFTNNIINGFPATYDTVDLDNVVNVDVAVAEGTIFTVWQDDNSGTVKFRAGTFNSTTGISGNTSQNLFSVFPNPASDALHIKLNNHSPNDFKIALCDITGKEIYFSCQSELKREISIPLQQISKGMYFLTVTNGEERSTRKISIQ